MKKTKTKKILALIMCALMVVSSVPPAPLADYFSVEARAVNVETLEAAIANVPPQDEWYKYTDTTALSSYYNVAVMVMKNYESFPQDYIDECAQQLQDAIDNLRFHTLGITLNNSSYAAAVNQSFTLRAILEPVDAADAVEWSSENSEFVSVDGTGVVTVRKYSATPVRITATSNGYSAYCDVTTLNPLGGVTLNHTTAEIYEGEKLNLEAVTYGLDSSALPTDSLTYSWESNNTSVASVSSKGVVTGLREGQATISVTVTNGKNVYSAACVVTVNEVIPVSSITTGEVSTSGTVNLTINETYDFTVVVLPSNASNKTLKWTSSDSSVVSISDEKTSSAGIATATLTAHAAGTVQVTYETTDGTNLSGSFTVIVKPLITSMSFTSDVKVLTLDTQGERFTTVIMPENAGNQKLSWSSSDEDICQVDYNGVLYPKALGTCRITAKTQDGTNIAVTGTVRVTEMAYLVSLSQASLSMNVPEKHQLSATVVTLSGSTYGDVQWSSSEPTVATVDDKGVVTAKYPGVAVIKATAIDGTEKYATCIVQVTQPLEELILPDSPAVYVGNTLKITPTFIPSYASNKNVTWHSSDPTVASIDQNGVVTGKAVGKTTITCIAQDGSRVATCVLTVLIATTGVSLNYQNATIWKDKTLELIPTVEPENATNKSVTWTSSDTSVATVDANGIVTGIAGGTCTITCTTKNSSKTATCEITVLESVTGVSLASDKLSLYLGQVYTNKASVIPSTATNKNVLWASNKDSVVRVSQTGEMTAVGEGTAIVTVKTEDGAFIASCEVTVYSKVPVTGLTINTGSVSLLAGEFYTIVGTVHPSNASNKNIIWKSNNTNVVAVAQTGLIKAKAAGTAVVTATTEDGNFTQQCTVTVTQPVTGVRLNAESVTIAKGKSRSLIANVLPTNATNQAVIWDSSDESVAKVSATGVVTAVGAGNCTITVTTLDGYFTATCDFSVYIPVTGIEISATSLKVPRGETRLLTAKAIPADASNTTIIWQSGNTNVATVNEAGQVTGRARGTTTIYATTADGGFIASCVVEVVQVATSVTLDYSSITLDVGAYKRFTATIKPATVSDNTVVWSTSNSSVVAVNQYGLIKGIAPGNAVITCTTSDGAASTTCRITVTQPVTGIKLNPTAMSVREGNIRAITATVLPANATDSKVFWSSSDNSIATVNEDGIVSGIKPGTVTVTATTSNGGFTASCTVKVIRSVTGMSLNKASITMNVGFSTTITPVFVPADASIRTATWTSSNYDVADVDKNGVVTAKAPGYAIITATSTDGGYSASCRVLCIQPVTGVKLSKTSLSLEVDERYTLIPNVLPANASDTSVLWSSSDRSVATVSSSGIVTGISQGTATITCKTVDGSFVATCKVTVLKKVAGVTLNYNSRVLYLDRTLQLKATVTPTDATNKGVYWYSGDKNVATVDQNGLVTPVSPGTVTIGVATLDGSFKAYCKITVKKPVEEITLNKSNVTLYVTQTERLTATVLPDDATDKTVVWTSSNPQVLAVNQYGLIKGLSRGTVTVTATAENGLTASCKVTVLQSATGVELNQNVLSVYAGDTHTLKASVLPAEANNKNVRWSSSDTAVAKVTTNGVVSGMKAGTAVITVTTVDGGFTASCVVTVLQHVESISFDKTNISLRKGEEADLTVKLLPADASDKEYTIESSDPQTVFVTQTGHIVALKGGSATITVRSKENNKTGFCYVTVIEPVTGVSLEKEEDTVFVGSTFSIAATVTPSDANNKALKWASSDLEVASISASGVITVLKSGVATIKVTTVDGEFEDECVLTCLQAPTQIQTEKEITVLRGESGKLTVTVLPEDSYDKEVTFESDDNSIVTVDAEGNFEAVAPGTATITVKAKAGTAEATCTITVIEPVTSINLKESKLLLYKGTEYQFTAEIYPSNASNQKVIWNVSDERVAKVDFDGKLIALSEGEAYVTVRTQDGSYIDYCKVTIVLAVESIEVQNGEISLIEGENTTIVAKALPENAYNTLLKYESADDSIATVDENGVVSAVSKGETYITVISQDNEEITYTVKVEVIRVVSDVTLSCDEEFVWVGDTVEIGATVTPADANDTSLLWTSSDEAVATVDENGVVTAVGAGTAIITAKTTDGRAEGTVEIEVRQQVESITLDSEAKTVSVDDVFSFTATVLPENAYNKDILWESSDDEVLTVAEDGTITAIATGEAVITATSAENGEIKATVKVTVIRMAEDIDVVFDKEYLWVGETGNAVATVLPEDTTDKTVLWQSSDEAVATVDENGVVTAVGAGTATITVKTQDNRAFEFFILEVRQQVESITLDSEEKTVSVDDVFSFTATVLPENAYNKDIIWESSDDEVLTVAEDGTITAIATGEAVITAVSAENGEIKATVKVTVIRMAEEVEVTFDKDYLWVGETGNAVATVLPEDTTDKSVSWTSSDEAVATVDENGAVTAVGAGTVTITAKTTDGRAEGTVEIEVRQQVESITLDSEERTVSVDDVFSFTATVLPENAYNKDIIWESSDDEVLTVAEDGTITAIATGEAVITAVSAENGEIKATVKVTVIRMAEEVEVTFDKDYLWVGETGNATATVLPEDTTDKSVSWISSDEAVATVDENGVVTAVGAGTATITAKTTDGRAEGTVEVEVRQQVESITLDSEEKTVSVDDVFSFTATVLPENAYNKDIIWESSDDEVLTVAEDGTITAIATGEAVITATSAENGEIKDTVRVTVIRYIDSIDFAEKAVTVLKGESYQLETVILPDDATERELTWTSSDDSTVSVDENGRITALKAGSATITVTTTSEGVYAECVVTVEVKSSEIRLDRNEGEIYCGESLTLTAEVLPEDTTNKKVIWTSSDEDIATVDENGVVTAKQTTGRVTITAKTEDTSISAECVIDVYKHVERVEMSCNSCTAYVGRELILSAQAKPDDATDRAITWKTSDSTVAKVENGVVTPLRRGTVIISAISEDGGFVDFCFVTVEIGIEEVSFDVSEISLDKGESYTVNTTIGPDTATVDELIWISEDEAIATVENGVITAGRKSGDVVIKAVAADNDNAYATCTVTVIEPVTAVELNEIELTLLEEEAFTLEAIIVPFNATYKDVVWKSSDEGVATVDENGVVSAVAPGTAIITCTNVHSSIIAQCEVFVPKLVESFTMSIGTISISKGTTADITVNASPADHDESFSFASLDSTIVQVDSETGVVRGVKAGTTTVTAISSLSGKTASIEITVIQPVEGISFSMTSFDTAYTSLRHQLGYSIYPSDAYNKDVVWSSSDEEIATVDSEGWITYHQKGEVTIRVTSVESGLYDECKVTVAQSPEVIYLDYSTMNLTVGQTSQLGFAITPIDSADKTVMWYTSDETIATVDQNGKVTAVNPGRVTITVRTWNGKEATCTVKVS